MTTSNKLHFSTVKVILIDFDAIDISLLKIKLTSFMWQWHVCRKITASPTETHNHFMTTNHVGFSTLI